MACRPADPFDPPFVVCRMMLITLLTNFQNFFAVSLISTRGWCLVHERFPLSSSSSIAFHLPGQCNGFRLILSHNITIHKSDLPANNHLHRIPQCIDSLKYLLKLRANYKSFMLYERWFRWCVFQHVFFRHPSIIFWRNMALYTIFYNQHTAFTTVTAAPEM